MIHFGAYNIFNGIIGGLKFSLRVILQINLDLGIFQYNKVKYGIYMCVPTVYLVLAADAPSRHPWVVFVFYWYVPHFLVK